MQVIVLVFVAKMRSSKYSWDAINTRMVVNMILFLQYVPRSIRIIILFMRLKWHVGNRLLTAWVQGLLNYFLYMTASHVSYFFNFLKSIQFMTAWVQFVVFKIWKRVSNDKNSLFDQGRLADEKIDKPKLIMLLIRMIC